MELHPTEVYYNLYINYDTPLPYGVFFVGNGLVFLRGYIYKSTLKQNFILGIEFINSYYKYNITNITTNSYKTIAEYEYNTIEDAINMKEIIKYWNKYKDYKFEKTFIYTTSFKIEGGDILTKTKYRTDTLVDLIIYNKMIKKEDMYLVPCEPNIREKINEVYNENIFDMNIFNYMFNMNMDFEC